tara:strand:- start:280 stop:702 length:423 start_codon:yes stop_codon:yes gene_type:complete
MYAIIDYKGNQILLKEGEKTRVPFVKDSKVGSFITFENVLFFDDGKKKQSGNPFIKNMNLKAKVLSHEKDSKVMVFKQKRRKGHQKKNGYRDNFTLIQIDKLSSAKQKKVTKVKTATKKTTTKKPATKKASTKTLTKTKK